MKKGFIILVATTMVVGLFTGCGADSEKNTSDAQTFKSLVDKNLKTASKKQIREDAIRAARKVDIKSTGFISYFDDGSPTRGKPVKAFTLETPAIYYEASSSFLEGGTNISYKCTSTDGKLVVKEGNIAITKDEIDPVVSVQLEAEGKIPIGEYIINLVGVKDDKEVFKLTDSFNIVKTLN